MKIVIALLLMMLPALAAPSSNVASTEAAAMAGTFSDPVLEARARNMQRQFRCLVCAGENVDESGSPFSADVRRLIREQIKAGRSDRQIEDFLVARYGDVILMRPPVQPDTWLLWLAPFLVLVLGGGVAGVVVKKASSRSA